MSAKNKIIVIASIFAVVGIAALWFLFTADIAVMNPKGLIAEKERDLIVIATLLMLIVVIPVFILTFWIAWKYRADKGSKYTPNWDFSWALESLWWGIPCVIVAALAVINWKACHELDPFKPIDSKVKPMTIQVVALQWKWLFIYPEQGIATVNFVQFPEKVPIHFEITADAPMNSFWIPQLGGQIYAMPGMRSSLHLIANEAGSYRGSSANISGEGFSGMTFTAKSSSQAEFNEWIESLKNSPSLQYDKLVEPSEYNPAAFYLLEEKGLFDKIMMKYMEQ